MKYILFLLSLLLSNGLCIGHSENPLYVYPVASFEQLGTLHMLVLKQWSLDDLELYDWNIATGLMSKTLMSMYTPAAVTMLPDASGFSFIDNGRIRIKRFEKRAVKSLDIYDPVYGIELINWLDNQTCYFHAQSDDRYGVYTLTTEEELKPVLKDNSVDYLYPAVVNQTIFFIERVKSKKQLSYKIGTRAFDDQDAQPQIIADFGSRVIMLLTMQFVNEGFVIEYVHGAECQLFHYHHLIKIDGTWQTHELFTFQVPHEFFAGPNRIYESILPLVPRDIGQYIYFSSYDESVRRLVLYRFNKLTKKSECIVQSSGNLFVPVFYGNHGWCGGTSYPFESIVY